MGGTRKALQELGGRSLLTHVRERLQPQVDTLLLSCEGETSDFDAFGLERVPDLLPGYRGPLTGLFSTLQYLSTRGQDNGLVVCPCDAPFIPENLVETLLAQCRGKNRPVVAVAWQGVLQPTFSLWQNQHLPMIRMAVAGQGIGGLKQVLLSMPHRIVAWADAEPPPFFNVNTPEDMETAALWLDRMQT
jgi:molybdopterin-guanine dinucleotide biosynthesis protein A